MQPVCVSLALWRAFDLYLGRTLSRGCSSAAGPVVMRTPTNYLPNVFPLNQVKQENCSLVSLSHHEGMAKSHSNWGLLVEECVAIESQSLIPDLRKYEADALSTMNLFTVYAWACSWFL